MNQPASQNTSASPSDAKGALVALFEAFPADRGEGSMAVGTYLIAVEGYSIKAIETAVRRIIRGEMDGIDKRFLPTPAQLSQAVAHHEALFAPRVRPAALPAPEEAEFTEDELRRRSLQAERYWAMREAEKPAAAKPMTEQEYDAWSSDMRHRLKTESLSLSPEALAIMKARAASYCAAASELFGEFARSA